MENQNLRIINSLGAANKKKLLKTFEHKTINDAIKHYTNISKRKYTEEEKEIIISFMSTFTDVDWVAFRVARDHLGTSFDILKIAQDFKSGH